MALTICPDCNRKISIRSEHCIYCGCPSLFYRDGEICEPDEVKQFSGNQAANKPEEFKFLTIRQTARETGLPEGLIRQLVKRKEIPFIQTGKKAIINSAHIQKYIDEH